MVLAGGSGNGRKASQSTAKSESTSSRYSKQKIPNVEKDAYWQSSQDLVATGKLMTSPNSGPPSVKDHPSARTFRADETATPLGVGFFFEGPADVRLQVRIHV